MTHTVTLLEDHAGQTAPRVMGHEYVVDAVLDITSYTANGETIEASSLGLSSVSCVVVSGISTDTIAGGYSVSVISAETGADEMDVFGDIVDGGVDIPKWFINEWLVANPIFASESEDTITMILHFTDKPEEKYTFSRNDLIFFMYNNQTNNY